MRQREHVIWRRRLSQAKGNWSFSQAGRLRANRFFSLTGRQGFGVVPVLFLLCLGLSSPVAAQVNDPRDNGTEKQEADSTKNAPAGIIYNREEATNEVLAGMTYSYAASFRSVKLYEIAHPDLDPRGIVAVNAVHTLWGNHYIDLGALGQSHLSIIPFATQTAGLLSATPSYPPLTLGLTKDPNEVYTSLHDSRFYQTQRPYTLLGYNNSLNKDYQINIVHTQNIRPRWNVAMRYDLISRDGEYTNAGLTTHLLDITTNYYSQDARYQLQAGIARHSIRQEENGGVQNDTTCWNIGNRTGVPVNMYAAENRWRNLELYAHQSYNTVRQFEDYRPIVVTLVDTIEEVHDSLVIIPRDGKKITDTTTVQVKTVRYEMRDTTVGYDTLLPYKPRVANSGVVGLDLQLLRQRRHFYDESATSWFYDNCTLDSTVYYDSTQLYHVSADLYWTNDAYKSQRWSNPLVVKIGLRPEYSRIVYLTSHRDYATLNPFAQATIQLGPLRMGLQAEKTFNSTKDGDYHLGGTLTTRIGKGGHLYAALATEGLAPDELYYHHEGCYTWDYTTFEKIRNSVAALRYEYQATAENRHLQALELSASGRRISNNIWLDDTFTPTQGNATGLLAQGMVLARMQWGWLHCVLQETVQHSSDEAVVRVPLFASKNTIYADLQLFRGALRLQTGFDLRYHTRYHADGWNPVLGAFYRQDNVEVGNHLVADYWLTLQIKRAVIYAKVSHFNAPLTRNPQYFSMPHYPMEDLGVYWGVKWHFFN